MAACENNTGLEFWENVRACEIYEWLEVLNAQQEEKLKAIKKAMKK